MKKLTLPLILCAVLLFLCSCHNQSYGILKYQDKKINAECTLNGEYKISIKKDGQKREIGFLEPPSLAHISFKIDGESVTGYAGALEIPFESENVMGILALSSIFSLGEEALSTASVTEDGETLEFLTEYGTYKLTLGKNEMPSNVQIYSPNYRYEITIDAIMIG